ncbi:osm1 [Symbiodinium pilosum]|uniref:Osm1 protein n=1 Tax=Symbiodinium pilosum TaxID=2952 RepID=A0A812R867_SYMPI|nr:osm1 [Symbiodinium pilosum]
MSSGTIAAVADHVSSLWVRSKGTLKAPDVDSHHVLGPQEELRFYHRSHFEPWALSPLLLDNEVAVTSSRVVVTESYTTRVDFKRLGFPTDACDSWKQESFDLEVVRGYEAQRVVPKLWQLLLPLMALAWCALVLSEKHPNVLDIIHDIIIMLPIEHALWLAGGTCRGLPVCRHSVAEPLRAAAGAIRKYSQLGQGGPPALLEIGRSGYRSKRYRRANVIQPDPAAPVSATTSFKATSRSDESDGSDGSGEPAVPADECTDFIPWSDMDANDCQKYAEPGWLLSCHDLPTVHERISDLDERLDAKLNLSPRDTCCACGGSNATGRALAISKLASAVYDVLESIDNSQEVESQIPAPTIASLKAVLDGPDGKQLLESRLLPLTNEELAAAGGLAGDSSAHLYFKKPQELLPAIELLAALFPSPHSAEEARATMDTNPEEQRQLQDVEKRSSSDQLSRLRDMGLGHIGPAMNAAMHFLSHSMKALSCFWRIYFLVLSAISGLAVAWWVNLLCRPVTYVVLRSHEKFFGQRQQMEQVDILMQNRFNSQRLIGFFLPTDRVSEFAAALGDTSPPQV